MWVGGVGLGEMVRENVVMWFKGGGGVLFRGEVFMWEELLGGDSVIQM